jgi:hypothetical protein
MYFDTINDVRKFVASIEYSWWEGASDAERATVAQKVWRAYNDASQAERLVSSFAKGLAEVALHEIWKLIDARDAQAANSDRLTIASLRADCVERACRAGWVGDGYELTDADMEWIAKQLGRPTRHGFSADELVKLGVVKCYHAPWLRDEAE